MSGKKGKEAEKLVASWLELNGWSVHRAAATGFKRLPNGKCLVQSHDMWNCIDILAFKRMADPGSVWYGHEETQAIQVTTASGKAPRRRKIEAHQWPRSYAVLLASHETTPDPAHRARRKHFLKLEQYLDGEWTKPYAIEIDVKAIESFRKQKAAQEKARKSFREIKDRAKMPEPGYQAGGFGCKA